MADSPPVEYDLITIFDVTHDMIYPAVAPRGIRGSLARDGSSLWHEFNVSSDLSENIKNPIGLALLFYNASTNYYMATSLEEGELPSFLRCGARREERPHDCQRRWLRELRTSPNRGSIPHTLSVAGMTQ
jgi:hypothetical protein